MMVIEPFHGFRLVGIFLCAIGTYEFFGIGGRVAVGGVMRYASMGKDMRRSRCPRDARCAIVECIASASAPNPDSLSSQNNEGRGNVNVFAGLNSQEVEYES